MPTDLSFRDFATLVRDLRAAQRGFFKSQPGTAERFGFLDESKRLEKAVDRAVADALDEQRTLFAGEAV